MNTNTVNKICDSEWETIVRQDCAKVKNNELLQKHLNILT